MPRVNIREIDKTGTLTQERLEYTVLVPGPVLTYKDGTALSGLLTAASQLNPNNFDEDTSSADFATDLGYIIAQQLLSHGLPVFFVPAYTRANAAESGDPEYGYDYAKNPVTGEEYTAETLFAEFTDKGKVDLCFVTIGGLFQWDEEMLKAAQAALACAAKRGDATALIDVPAKGDLGAQEGVELNTSKLIDKWVQDNFYKEASTTITRKGISWVDNKSETCGRYGAVFAPLTFAEVPVYVAEKGMFVNTNVLVPASFIYLTSFAEQIASTPCWFATAGAARGLPVYKNVKPSVIFGDADIELLQARSSDESLAEDNKNNGHIACNVICPIRPFGNIIWGSRTMHPLESPAGDPNALIQLQASSFLNIRQLCSALKKTIYKAAKRYTFDPNSDALWYNFRGAITPLLDQMKANQGIRGYQMIQIPTKKKALLVTRIIISPIEPVEDFDCTVELSDSVEVAEE